MEHKTYRSGHGRVECDTFLLVLVHLACLVFECRGAPGREATGFVLEFEPGIDVTGKDTRLALIGREVPGFVDLEESVSQGDGF